MKLKVLNIEGKETGKEVELPAAIFGVEPNDHAIYLAVKQFQANGRQGTHKSKERNEIAGSTKKIKKQKGTGTARAGSIKSPIFRGGGRIFGPKPRDYSFKLNKKVKDLARNSAFTYKAQKESIVVIEDLSMEAPKTKQFTTLLKNIGAEGKKTLLLLPAYDKNVVLSSRNLTSSQVSLAAAANTYDVMNSQVLILAESSVKQLTESLTNN